jgi:putative SOS response-associated peptidase YedK
MARAKVDRVVPRRDDESLRLTPEEREARLVEFDRRSRIARRKAANKPPPTMGGVRRETEWIWVYCETMGCGHSAAVPLVPLIIRWGPDAPWDYMRRCWRCTRCGGRKTTTRTPSWGGEQIGFLPVNESSRWTGEAVWPEPLSMHYLEGRSYGDGKIDYHPVLGSLRFDLMCNLYSQTRSRDEVRNLFHVSDNRAYAFEPMPAIFPKSVAPIIRVTEDGEREMAPATWGFPLLKQGYAPKPVTNVRDDTVRTSRFWRPSFDARRCLVPASSYCEPDSNSPARWHWFALKNGNEERPMFAFPGIWKRYRGPLKKDGPDVEVDVYAFMTTKPNSLTATIMHDRMPVLLSNENDFETWLTGTPGQAYGLVRTYPADAMHIVQSGREKLDLLGEAADATGFSL